MSSITDLLSEFNTKKQNYLADAFAKNRALRAKYKQISTALLELLRTNVRNVTAEQTTIHKDISYFNNLVTLTPKTPPMPYLSYSGSTTTIDGKEVPQMPLFLYTTPAIEIENATATALSMIMLAQFSKTSIAANPDFENAFAKYYRFTVVGAGPGGTTTAGFDASVPPLLFPGAVYITSSDIFKYEQRIVFTREINDASNNLAYGVNAFIYAGELSCRVVSVDNTSSAVELPAVLIRFEAIKYTDEDISNFQGLRLINTKCTGTAMTASRPPAVY
jgi:hypothetical protein